MKLAIFDLDNTLIAGDSDYLWGQFLTEKNYVDGQSYAEGHDKFYADYVAGQLDIQEFLRFQLKPLADTDHEELLKRRQDYIDSKIRPVILAKAIELIESHREKGHQLLIITATNEFLTRPIADILGIEELIGCQAEMIDGQYTGQPVGIPSFQDGKIKRLEMWLEKREEEICESWFYSDSRNDIPLLEYVDHAFAVDPDDKLRKTAEERQWPVLSLR